MPSYWAAAHSGHATKLLLDRAADIFASGRLSKPSIRLANIYRDNITTNLILEERAEEEKKGLCLIWV